MKAKITRWRNLVDTRGEAVELTWDEVFGGFSLVVPFRGDRAHPGWSAATFEPCERAEANVTALSAAVLDYDGTESIEAAEALWGEHYGLIHTTRKHSVESHRFRVILPFSRPVSPFEYRTLWPRLAARSGGKIDPATKDCSRFWFVPGIPPDGMFTTCRLGGSLLDPDQLLNQPEPPKRSTPVTPIRDATAIERRALAYIAKMPEAISGSGGHQATWNVALVLAQGFGLSEERTFQLLMHDYNPRCVPPWSEKELRHKASDAAKKAKVPPGYKLDDRRDYPVPDDHYRPPANDLQPSKATSPELEAELAAQESTEAPASQEPPRSAVERHRVRTMAEVLHRAAEKARSEKEARGCPTGHPELDETIGGYRPRKITVFGADTSWGKSSFGIMGLDECLKADWNVLLVSGEDDEETYGDRILARRARINAVNLRDSKGLDADDLNRITTVEGQAEKNPFFIDGIGKTAEQLARVITDLAREMEVHLVIIDYLQAFKTAKPCQDRRNEITHIARLFTDAIKSIGAAGLMFSQLKRPSEAKARKPTMHDLKESGDVENMAEHVLLGYVDGHEAFNEAPEKSVFIAKNKDGPKHGNIPLPWDDATASFVTQYGVLRTPQRRQWRNPDDQAFADIANEFDDDFEEAG